MSVESHLQYHSKAKKALELAKKAEAIRLARGQKAIKIPNGLSGDVLYQNMSINYGMNFGKKLPHADVVRLADLGTKPSEIAKRFNVTPQSIYYIINKAKKELECQKLK